MLSSEVRDISALDEEDGDICWRDCVAPYDNDVPPPRELDPVRRELVRPLEIVVSVTNGPLQFHTATPNHPTPERLSSSLEYSLSYCFFLILWLQKKDINHSLLLYFPVLYIYKIFPMIKELDTVNKFL